jgi:flagellar basal body rod protein FlgB
LTVFSPQFFDQLYLVEYLARILPSSVELIVKAHPHHPGRPTPGAMRQLTNNERITFLHYDTHAHEVIEQAEAVVVVNNTIGYESIYFQKPLIALGNLAYADTPAVTKVDALEDLPAVLSETISTTVSEETAVESIYSLQETTWDGNTVSYDPENVQTLVDSIQEFMDS